MRRGFDSRQRLQSSTEIGKATQGGEGRPLLCLRVHIHLAVRSTHLSETTHGDDGYLGLFRRNPDFTRLYIGQLLSYGGDWFLTVAVLALVSVVAWYALQPRCAFVVHVLGGIPRATSGKVTPAFLDRVRQLCAEHAVAQAVIRGIIRGNHIALACSGNIPPTAQQQLRNWWALSGWPPPVKRR